MKSKKRKIWIEWIPLTSMLTILTNVVSIIIFVISVFYIVKGGIRSNDIASKYGAKLSDIFSTQKNLPEKYYEEIDKANRMVIKGFLTFIIGGLTLAAIIQLIKYLGR